MSVARNLQADSPTAPTLATARARWIDWMRLQPDLNVVEDPVSLPSWTVKHPSHADAILRALVRIGALDRDAITFVCWLMKPAAVRIAVSHADAHDRIDDLVTSHLWTAVVDVDPDSTSPVAASIKRATLRGVQAELGIGEGARRLGRTAERTIPVDATVLTNLHPADVLSDPAVTLLDAPARRLLDLLDAATAAGAITSADRRVLIDLAVAADRHAPATCASPARGTVGLLAHDVSNHVAQLHGVSARTVRRRARASLDKLRDFAHQADLDAAA